MLSKAGSGIGRNMTSLGGRISSETSSLRAKISETSLFRYINKGTDREKDLDIALGDLNTMTDSDTTTYQPTTAPIGTADSTPATFKTKTIPATPKMEEESTPVNDPTASHQDRVDPDHWKLTPPRKSLVITLTIMAKPDRSFSGSSIRETLQTVGMRFGDMHIFHHFGMANQQNDSPVFSAADALEPGIFDEDTLDNHTTKGLILFMRLPGPLEGLVAFELMLSTGQQLAKFLDGELCDETRSTLTAQATTHLRERIGEFKRKQLV